MNPVRLTVPLIFGCLIVLAAFLLLRPFVPALLWALIASVMVWPIHSRCIAFLKGRSALVSAVLTILLALIIIVPLWSILKILISESQVLFNFLLRLDKGMVPAPSWLKHLPSGAYFDHLWTEQFSKPGGMAKWLESFHLSFHPASMWMQRFGGRLVHWFITLFFTLLALFFFLKDGDKMLRQIKQLGSKHLGEYFARYWVDLSRSMAATVNGTIVLSLLLGLIMGFVYWGVGLQAPVLTGFLTAILAMIPFGALIVFVITAAIVYAQSGLVAAIILFSVGVILNFIMDHFARPYFIGTATRLPFLAILFGILGGVELMGLLGLFIGPMIMVAFMSLWRSSVNVGEKKALQQ